MTNVQTIDRATDLANFIATESADLGADALATIEAKFGDLTQDQFDRGIAMGATMLDEQAAAHEAHAEELRLLPERRAQNIGAAEVAATVIERMEQRFTNYLKLFDVGTDDDEECVTFTVKEANVIVGHLQNAKILIREHAEFLRAMAGVEA